MSVQPWKVLDSKYLLTEPWMTVRADSCETDQGVQVSSYFVHESCDWVQVLALDEQQRVLLTKQYRHGAGEVCWELPAGCVDPDEAPLTAIKRELLEETGCIADSFEALPRQFSNPARCNNFVHPYIAHNVRQVCEPQQEPSENIEFTFMSVQQLQASIDAGEFRAGLHIGTVFLGLQKLGLL